jgi:hypothetical protein
MIGGEERSPQGRGSHVAHAERFLQLPVVKASTAQDMLRHEHAIPDGFRRSNSSAGQSDSGSE